MTHPKNESLLDYVLMCHSAPPIFVLQVLRVRRELGAALIVIEGATLRER